MHIGALTTLNYWFGLAKMDHVFTIKHAFLLFDSYANSVYFALFMKKEGLPLHSLAT